MPARQLIVCVPGAHIPEQGWLNQAGRRDAQVLASLVKSLISMPNTTTILSGPFGWECETAEIIASALIVQGLSHDPHKLSADMRSQIEVVSRYALGDAYEAVIVVTTPETGAGLLSRICDQVYRNKMCDALVFEPGTAVCLDFQKGNAAQL